MVIIFRCGELISVKQAYNVVVFPLPVGPTRSTIPDEALSTDSANAASAGR